MYPFIQASFFIFNIQTAVVTNAETHKINLVNELSMSEMPSFIELLILMFLHAFVFRHCNDMLMKCWFFRENIAAVSNGTIPVHVGAHKEMCWVKASHD